MYLLLFLLLGEPESLDYGILRIHRSILVLALGQARPRGEGGLQLQGDSCFLRGSCEAGGECLALWPWVKGNNSRSGISLPFWLAPEVCRAGWTSASSL